MNNKELYTRLKNILSEISEEDYPEIYNIIENELDFSGGINPYCDRSCSNSINVDLFKFIKTSPFNN